MSGEQWVRTSGVSIANGGNVFSAVAAVWKTYARPGNGISFDGGSKYYEIASIDENNEGTIVGTFAEVSVVDGSCIIDNRGNGYTPAEVDLLRRINALLAGKTYFFRTNGPPDTDVGTEGDLAVDAAARIMYSKDQPGWDTGTSLGGPGYGGESATSNTIATSGVKTWDFPEGYAYVSGQYVRAIARSAPANYMEGPITAYGGGVLSIDVKAKLGSGTFDLWDFAVTGVQGAQGNTGAKGDTGNTGASGASAGLTWNYSNNAATNTDPGAGKARLNHATIMANVTEMAFSDTTVDAGTPNARAFVGSWGNPTSTVKGYVFLRKKTGVQNLALFSVSAITAQTGYTRVTVAHIASAGTFTDLDDLIVDFLRTGDKGDTGAKGDKGDQGNAGWSPVFANESDGARRVLKVTDWTGGAGTKPAINKYVGLTGLVDAIGSGVDVRGASGANFNPDARGAYVTRSTYDASDEGFCFLSIDGDGLGGTAAVLFFKNSATSGDWSDATPFQGPKGDTGAAGTTDYNALSNKPALGTAAPLDVDIDGTLAANADNKIPTQKAVATALANRTGPFRAGGVRGAANMLNGDEGFCADFITRTAFINDYADTLSNVGRPADLLTVVRSTTKYVMGRAGLLTSVAANVLAYDHDPVTGAPLGVLVEGSRTNILLQSQTLDNASWSKTRATVTANAVAAPDGTTTADKIVEDSTASATHNTSQGTLTFSAGRYIGSCWLLAAGRTAARMQINDGTTSFTADFDLSAGSVTATSGATARITKYLIGGVAWYRCELYATVAATSSGSLTIFLMSGAAVSYNGDGTSGVYAWGAQLELTTNGARASSYIPTTTASVARSADQIYIPVSALPGTPANACTIFIEGILRGANGTVGATNGGLLQLLQDSTNRSGLRFITSATTGAYVDSQIIVSNASQADTGNITVLDDVVFKSAMACGINDMATVVNGGVASTDNSYSFPSAVANLSLGGAPGSLVPTEACPLHILSARYVSRRMTNAELQAMTL